VFHSIIVAEEVLKFREKYIGHPEKPCLHPPSDIMLNQARQSIDSIINNEKIKNLMSERSLFLLEKCSESIDLMKNNLSIN
jgi:hypothetical protein